MELNGDDQKSEPLVDLPILGSPRALKPPAKPRGPMPEGFTGFGRGALPFLAALAENNNRDWFTANRATYDRDIAAPMAALVTALAFACETRNIKLTGDPKRAIFRINRDVRFSKDKSPYKTNASCVLSRDGSKQGLGILYLQIGGAEGAFMASGFHAPEPEDLHALRQAIASKPTAWLDVQDRLGKSNLILSSQDSLARLPKGFETHKDSLIDGALRLKSLVVRRPITLALVHSLALIEHVIDFAEASAPLLVDKFQHLSPI